MKSKLSALLLLAACALPALADIDVTDMSVQETQALTGVRFTVKNTDRLVIEKGPFTMNLYVRPDKDSAWKIAKIITEPKDLKASGEFVQEVTSQENPVLLEMKGHPHWQSMVVVKSHKGIVAKGHAEIHDSANR